MECGTKHVDAVEIDPAISSTSRRHFNAGAPYSDPRVAIHIDDARSYMAKATPGYDMVVFGFLDSQALFSTMSNVSRLDGYVYTVESLRTAFRLLNDHGMLTLSFFLGKALARAEALLSSWPRRRAGRRPHVPGHGGRGLILCVPKDPATILPQKVFQYTRAAYSPLPRIDLPTDDWPFLYLIRKTDRPSDYLITRSPACSRSPIATIAWLQGPVVRERRRSTSACSGWASLLLETKGISDSTALLRRDVVRHHALVVTGVLLMVMGANLVAWSGGAAVLPVDVRAPLPRSLAVLLIVPRESVLQFDFRRAPPVDPAGGPAAGLLRGRDLLDDVQGNPGALLGALART